MSKHTMTAWAPFGLDETGLPVDIAFTYTPGRPASLWSDAPHPADPEEVDFHSVTCADLALPPHYQKLLDEWAVEFLAGELGRERAREHVTDREDA